MAEGEGLLGFEEKEGQVEGAVLEQSLLGLGVVVGSRGHGPEGPHPHLLVLILRLGHRDDIGPQAQVLHGYMSPSVRERINDEDTDGVVYLLNKHMKMFKGDQPFREVFSFPNILYAFYKKM